MRVGNLVALLCSLVSCGFLTAGSITFYVPATSNPFLAGMPDGSACCSGDSAPAESPVLVSGLSLQAGTKLTFTDVTGSMGNQGPSDSTPDGLGFYQSGPTNGIGGYVAPIDALAGVFLGNSLPTSTPAPAALDYSTLGTTFSSFSPQLKQVFFIGDGLTGKGTGSIQTFVVPIGATRFFLGDVDGFGWYNNGGAVSGSVSAGPVPEPSSAALLIGAFCLLGWMIWRKPSPQS